MKKFTNYFLSMLAIAGMLFMTSCGDDEDTATPTAKGPSVFLVATDSTISADVTLTAGASFGIIVNATKGDKNMDTWELTRDGQVLSGFAGDAPDPDNFTVPIANIPVPANEGTYTYKFSVTDKDGVVGSKEWKITVANAATLTETTNVQLGGQSNATLGSFYQVDGSNVLLLSAANSSNGADVDFFYYYGATNKATLFGPTDAQAGDLFSGAVAAWTTRNATKISASTLDYSAVTAEEVASASASGTKANDLAADDVVVFETAGGMKGILKVTSVAVDGSGSVTFDVKVLN